MFEDIFPPIKNPIPEDTSPCDDVNFDDLTEEDIDQLVEEMIDDFFNDITGGQL